MLVICNSLEEALSLNKCYDKINIKDKEVFVVEVEDKKDIVVCYAWYKRKLYNKEYRDGYYSEIKKLRRENDGGIMREKEV